MIDNKDRPATAVQFKNPNKSGGEDITQWKGLTKREAFAMAAMQGMSSHPEFYGQSNEFAENIACDAVKFADALLAELEK